MSTFQFDCGGNLFQIFSPGHHISHEWSNGVPPDDALTVHPRMFALMRGVVIKGSVLIKISPFYYIKNNEFKVVGETIFNTTPYLAPTPNKVRLAVVGFNFDTETIETYTGNEVIFSALTPPPLPAGLPDNFFPSFLVRLRYNTLELFETDITDARFALQQTGGSATGGNVWPKPDKLNIGATEYSTVALAIAAAISGDTIYAGVGTFACDDLTLSDGVNLYAADPYHTIFTSSTQLKTLTLGIGCDIGNITVTNTTSSGSTTVAITTAVACTLTNIIANATNPGAGAGRGLDISGSSTVEVHFCNLNGKTFGYNLSGTASFDIYGGKISYANIDAGTFVNHYHVPRYVTGLSFSLSATIKGLYYTADTVQTLTTSTSFNLGNTTSVNQINSTITNNALALVTDVGVKAYVDASGVFLTDESATTKIKYATLAAAIAAAASGDTIKLDTDTYSVSASQNIGVSLTIEGDGPEATHLSIDLDDNACFDFTANGITVTFKDMTILADGDGTYAGVFFNDNSGVKVILDNCIVRKNAGTPTNGYGAWFESGLLELRNGSKLLSEAGTNKYGFMNFSTAVTLIVGAGCEVGGVTQDIYGTVVGSTLNFNNGIATNGMVSWAGVLNWQPENKISKNLLYSSLTHNIWQEGLTLNDLADDTYGPDTLWNVLNKDNAPDVAGIAGGSTDPFTTQFRCTFDSNTAQAGIVQFLEATDTYPLRGQVVSLSADLWGTNITSLRMAVAIWTSTADSLTSDIVGTWAAGNPTLATNWAYIGTPAAITITSTRTRYTVNNLLVPTNANNLAVFIWTDAEESSGDLWNVTRVQLERGPVATEFVARSMADELARVQWFFLKSFNLTVAPGVSTINQYAEITTRNLAASTAGIVLITTGAFPVRMRTTPTVVLYSPDTGAANAVLNASSGADRTGCSVVGLGDSRFSQIIADNTSATVISAGQGIQFHFTANARL